MNYFELKDIDKVIHLGTNINDFCIIEKKYLSYV